MRPTPILLLSLLLSGCETGPRIEYRYFPPNTDTGLLCVAMCQNTRMQCKQTEQLNYRNCKMQEEMRHVAAENCRLRSKDNSKDNSIAHCYHGYTETCWSPNYWVCDQQYRECYQNCGGEVEAYTVKDQ